jgi:hypothetical protein
MRVYSSPHVQRLFKTLKQSCYGVVLFLTLNSCAHPVSTMSIKPVTQENNFHLYLQPLPQEAESISFHLAELVALPDSGGEIILALKKQIFSLAENKSSEQLKLSLARLPSGRYKGLALRIARASVKGERGEVDLLPPETISLLEPFTIENGRTRTLFVQLSGDRLVTDGAIFTPQFSLWQAPNLLPGLKGFLSTERSHDLVVFNKRNLEVVDHIQVGDSPQDLALDQQRGWLYVALAAEDVVAVIEISSQEVLGRVHLRLGDEPTELSLNEDGTTLLALNRGSDSISIIDTRTLFESGRLRLPSEADNLFYGSDGIHAYAIHTEANRLTYLAPQRVAIERSQKLRESPLDGIVDSGGTVYLINDFSANLTTVSDASSASEQRILIGKGALCLLQDSASSLIYIGHDNGHISIIDPFSLSAIDTFSPTTDAIVDLSLDEEQNALFALFASHGYVLKIDPVGREVESRLFLDGPGRGIVIMGER